MAGNINTSTGFEIGAAKPVDDRFVFQTLAERNVYNQNLLYIGLLCYVVQDNTYYTYKGNGTWQESVGNSSVHRNEIAPTNKDLIWINTKDEIIPEISDVVLDEFKGTIQTIKTTINQIQYGFDHVIDPGGFVEESEETSALALIGDETELPNNTNLYPNENPTGEPPENTNLLTGEDVKPNANHILLKRGYKSDLPILHDGELGYCKDTNELYIGCNGRLVLVNGGTGDSTSNVTAEYIDLLSPSKKTYRVTISDEGALRVQDMDEYNKPDPLPSDANLFAGLIINHIYGGGYEGANNTPVSHGFIELYNSTENTINLKGLSVHYGEYNKGWRTLNLFGVVPPKTSFLIRGAQHTAPELARVVIDEYDMSWNVPFMDTGMKVYLSVGRNSPRTTNPWASNGDITSPQQELGYIDLIGCNAQDTTLRVDGFETAAPYLMSRTTSARRNDFADTGSNAKDLKPFDFGICSDEEAITYRPRCVKDGRWDVYFDKTKMDTTKPNLLTLGFGQDASKTRTFLWHSVRSAQDNFVLYKKQGAADWTKVKASKEAVQYPDIDIYKWTAMISNLQAGVYTYKVGEEGKWSDEYNFTVKSHADNLSYTFVQVTDQQAWNAMEYDAWKKSARYILDNETFDWVLNTGDYSQNGDRAFEWRDYHGGAYDMHKKFPLMGTIGNNDLVRKVESWAYTYYCNTENNAVVDGKEIVSCNCWEIGDTWFCCLNSNEDVDAQARWFVEAIQKTTKKWKIVYTHDAPYTISKWQDDKDHSKGMYRNDSKLFYTFAKLFEDYGVHLVMCGHKHAYMRSGPIYNSYVIKSTENKNNRYNEPEREGGNVEGAFLYLTGPNPNDPTRPYLDYQKGVYYVMCNATGYKLISNKDIAKPDWYYSQGHGFQFTDSKEQWPQYMVWTITPEKIIGKAYKLMNVKAPNSNDNGGVIYKSLFDSFEIPFIDKNYTPGRIVTEIGTAQVGYNLNHTFGVKLSKTPMQNQLVNFAYDDLDISVEKVNSSDNTTVGERTLLFTPENYNTYQYVRVGSTSSGVESAVIEFSITPIPSAIEQFIKATVSVWIDG